MFAHEFMRNALLASTGIALAAGLAGYFLVLRGQVFAADALSHVAFTGGVAALAFGFNELFGLLVATVLAAVLLNSLSVASRAGDVEIGVFFALILGLGVLFISIYVSGHSTSNSTGGVGVLFGSVFGISAGQARTAVFVSLGAVVSLLAIARPLLFASVDSAAAAAQGIRVGVLGPHPELFGSDPAPQLCDDGRALRALPAFDRHPDHAEGPLMKAVVYDRYGPPEVLRIADVERPVPKGDEVLIKVHATTVNRLDVHTREANRSSGLGFSVLSRLVSGLRTPRRRILGSEFAGEVEAVGATVNEFAVGDHVFGNSGLRFGAHAEFMCMRESARIAHMPAGVSFGEAAPITDGALNALTCLTAADLRKGRRILIYGASGAIGTAGVQLARHFDADVTAVCSTKNLELVKSLGADWVIDYTKEDFTKNGQTYHVIFDAVGKHSFKRSRDSLEPGGIYLPTDGFENLFLALWTPRVGDKRVVFQIPPRQTKQDVLFLKQLVEAGEFRPVIDRTYALEDVVEATRYVETEQKTGNVGLTV